MTVVSLTRNGLETTWYLNKKNYLVWSGIKGGSLAKWDEDRVYIIDGKEGTGKSLFTIQQAAAIDPTILDDEGGKLLPRICFTVEEFIDALRNTKSDEHHTKAVIFDEGFRGFSTKAALSKANKLITQTMMEVRQNNLAIFIVSPNVFMLDWYLVQHRGYALFHIIKVKGSRKRYFKCYGQAKMNQLYDLGKKKGWAYPIKTKHKDWFYAQWPGGDDFELRYRKKKALSFRTEHKEEKDEAEGKFKQERRWFFVTLFLAMKKYKGFTQDDFVLALKQWFNIEMTRNNVGEHMDKTRKEGKMPILPE